MTPAPTPNPSPPTAEGPPGGAGGALATLGGGCFWCTEAVFSDLRGVTSVVPGYSGGRSADPTYEQVCEGNTGHAEVVQVAYDPAVISYRDLLSIFFTVHDPTTRDRQGHDVGTQYRSVVFFRSAAERAVAEQVVAEVEREKLWRGKIVTELAPFVAFYPAEAYHRDYFRQHPEQAYCQMVIAPKVAKFRQHFAERLRARTG
ncbi:MAG TPA: peptide-methionine (S)-S-oxide reductase MsrA [Thermoplasmata archaeon]|nr:peptide-methionine (S)-S-oxide reductase MsrA [Thermoplasmata archaeon]